MKIALAVLSWTVALAGGSMICAASQLYHIRPGVFGAEGLMIAFAIWMTLEARKCG